MAHPDNGHPSIDMNSRFSQGSSITPSFVAMQHHDDNFDYDSDDDDTAGMGISDGFRSSNTIPNEPMRMAGHDHQRISSIRMSQHQPPSSPQRRSTPPPRPSSATKPRGLDSLALRHDGHTNHNLPFVSSAFASSSSSPPSSQFRRTSTASSIDSFVPRPESPYRGPSAPSHPYQIYNQNAPLTRTVSVATTSTYQPHIERESIYNGPSGPTHPYTLYPQNTVEEPEIPVVVAPMIPVGFPGRVDEYQRRLGPEGEEAADLIGPDGHTEQLPPYTQYPDAAFARKTAAMSAAVPLPITLGQSSASGSEPLAQQGLVNPFETPISRSTSIGSQTLNNREPASVMSAMSTENEKSQLKPWQVRMKRKVCGIVPTWVLVLAALLVVLFIIIASVAATLVKKNDRPPPPKSSSSATPTSPQNQYATTVTTTYDATTLPTAPSGLPSLPTGTYWLNIESAQTQSTSCIPNTAEYAAWSCSMSLGMLRMNVQSPTTTSGNRISIFESQDASAQGPAPSYFYGTQPPTISDAQVMSLVSDVNYKSYGPAWFFQLPYDKLVIVSPGALSVPTSKRSLVYGTKYTAETGYDPTRRGQAPGVGDTPWFCFWNHTLLETFIYPQVNSSYNAQAASASSSASASAATGGSATSSSKLAAASGGTVLTQFVPPYPKIVRVKERRLPTSAIEPYCLKMQIQQSGWATPFLDGNGQQVKIQLNETEQTIVQSNGRRDGLAYMEETVKRDTGGDCNCVWLAS